VSVPWFTLDRTDVTLDSTTAFTWDEDIFAAFGYVLLFDTADVASAVRGDARAEGISFDRELHRNPFGQSWFTSGGGRLGPQLLRVTLEVWSDSIANAHAETEALRVRAEDCARVLTSYGEWPILALQSFSRSPIEAGYRVDAVFVTAQGRL
jgi:hypothetical protein